MKIVRIMNFIDQMAEHWTLNIQCSIDRSRHPWLNRFKWAELFLSFLNYLRSFYSIILFSSRQTYSLVMILCIPWIFSSYLTHTYTRIWRTAEGLSKGKGKKSCLNIMPKNMQSYHTIPGCVWFDNNNCFIKFFQTGNGNGNDVM